MFLDLEILPGNCKLRIISLINPLAFCNPILFGNFNFLHLIDFSLVVGWFWFYFHVFFLLPQHPSFRRNISLHLFSTFHVFSLMVSIPSYFYFYHDILPPFAFPDLNSILRYTLLFFTSLLECLELWGLLQFCFYFLNFFPLVELLVQAPWTGQAWGWQPQAERDDTGDSPPVLDRPGKLALSTWPPNLGFSRFSRCEQELIHTHTHTHKGPAQPNCNPLRWQPGSMRSEEPFAS